MKKTSINTDFYWDGITNLCGELLYEMETLINDKYNGIANVNVGLNDTIIKKIYVYKDNEDIVMDNELAYELDNGDVNLVRELDINTMLEIAEVL